MDTSQPRDITHILKRASTGNKEASERLFELVYDQLRYIARHRMSQERPGITLQATELVHEAYIRVVGEGEVEWENRAHFFAIAAEAMRRILIEHARRRARKKRGGGLQRVPLNVLDLAVSHDEVDILALDDAVERLAQFDPRMSKIVSFRFFAGLSVKETAEALRVSPATVKREWSVARAWLYRVLRENRTVTPESSE